MPRIKKEYEDYSPDFNEITPEERAQDKWESEMDELLCAEIEEEFESMTNKKKIRLTGKYSEKRYIP